MKKTTELSASSLKNSLWETLNELKEGGINPAQGDSIATQAREILRTVKTQMQIATLSGRSISADVIAFGEK